MDFLNGVVREELEILAVDGEVMNVAGFQNFPKFSQHVGTFVLELFEFWGEENHVVGEAFEESGFSLHNGIYDQSKAIAIAGGGEEIDILFQMGGGDVFSDAFAYEGFHFARADGLDEFAERGFLRCIDVFQFRPLFDFFDGKKSCAHAVGKIVERISGIVCPIHDLAFDGFERIAGFSRSEFDWKIVSSEAPIEEAVLGVVDKMIFRRLAICDEFRPKGFVFQDAVEERA